MDKVKVEICCGTACYLLGAAKLTVMEDTLPPDIAGRVEFAACTCLGMCGDDGLEGAPFVRFNGAEVMSNASPDKITFRIRELLGIDESEVAI